MKPLRGNGELAWRFNATGPVRTEPVLHWDQVRKKHCLEMLVKMFGEDVGEDVWKMDEIGLFS